MQIVLASGSPRRKELLSYLVSDFKVIPAEVDEKKFEKLARTPEELVVGLAKMKAKSIICHFREVPHNVGQSRKSVGSGLDCLLRDDDKKMQGFDEVAIIAADTTVVLQNKNKWEIIDKPVDEKDARKILRGLRGRTHKVFTGLCLLRGFFSSLRGSASWRRRGNLVTLTDCVVSEVTFKNFSDKVMEKYIKSGKSLDKAGAYGIQEIEDKFVEKFKGSFTNIMGLPVKKLAEMLKDFKVCLKKDWKKRIKKVEKE